MRYRSEVDGLRALAVVPVILFHAGVQAFNGGFVGVDVFFVISGYLITTILLNELESGSFSIIRFYERRARRILPALFLVMFVSLSFAWFWLFPDDMKTFSESLTGVSAFASNFVFWHQSGYFDTATKLKPLIHTWSLAVEEQFYLLFPLFLLLAWRLGKRWVLSVLAITAAISLLAAQWGSYTYRALTFFMLPTRAWELGIGAFIAFYYTEHNIKHHKHWAAQWGSLLGLILITFAVFTYSKETPFPSFYALAPTLGAALIIIFATHETWTGKLLSSKPFVGIGLISYSAYLWHQPMFAFARRFSVYKPSNILMMGLAILSIMLAYASWRFVERPFRNKHKFTRKQVFVFGIVGSLIFAVIGITGSRSHGFENRLSIEERDTYIFGQKDIFNGARRSDGSCVKMLGLTQLSEEACLTNSSSPTMLFAGDSHAMALYSSIYGKLFNYPAILIAAHACSPYPNLSYTPTYKFRWGNNCTEISNEVLRVAKNLKSINTVVLINCFCDVRVNKRKSRYWLNGVNLNNELAFEDGFGYLIGKLLSMNKRVIFMVDVPDLKSGKKGCFQNPIGGLPELDCRKKAGEIADKRQSYLAEVKSLKNRFPSLIIYDPTNLFCDNAYCEIIKRGKSLYFDQHHISIFGSSLVVNDMFREHVLIKSKNNH